MIALLLSMCAAFCSIMGVLPNTTGVAIIHGISVVFNKKIHAHVLQHLGVNYWLVGKSKGKEFDTCTNVYN